MIIFLSIINDRYSIRETMRHEKNRMITFNPDDSLITIHPENIIDMLDVPPGQADPYVKELIASLIQECLELVSPSACFGRFKNPEIDVSVGTMKLEGHLFSLNKMVATCLQKSEEVYFFIGTCGKEVENFSRQQQQRGNLLEGYIIDLIGSEIAESIAEIIHNTIDEEARTHGMSISNRYSPGYCGWPVSDQQKLFSLMPGNTCGVYLTDSSLMLPIKSVSGVVGAGKELKRMPYQCSKCDAEYCIYRDKRKKI